MFGRKKDDSTPAQATPGHAVTPEEHDPTAPKGRATPSRREAQEARKQQRRIPKDPKAAKKASRDRDREERYKARQAMAAGDERYLPARDRGPARAFTRDFIDARFTAAEFFIFIAVAVLVLGFVRNTLVQQWVSIAFFAFTVLIVLDTAVLVITLQRRAKAAFPDPADRKGLTLYAILRALQLRRLRLPKPRVRRGGAPVIK